MKQRVRLLDNEGRNYGEFITPKFMRIIELPAIQKLTLISADNLLPIAPALTVIRFDYERTAGDGVLIYRRVTPLWYK